MVACPTTTSAGVPVTVGIPCQSKTRLFERSLTAKIPPDPAPLGLQHRRWRRASRIGRKSRLPENESRKSLIGGRDPNEPQYAIVEIVGDEQDSVDEGGGSDGKTEGPSPKPPIVASGRHKIRLPDHDRRRLVIGQDEGRGPRGSIRRH
jgi:hypothetical protein